jgi:hypothetical protein
MSDLYREKSLEEKLFLSAWEKWKKYHIFPWKFVIHILISLLAFLDIIYQATFFTANVESVRQGLNTRIIPQF